MPINYFFKINAYNAIIATNTETKTIDTVLSNFITVFSAGPAVSLYGSPIISPTIATLCYSVPFSPFISMSFLALSQAPPVFTI